MTHFHALTPLFPCDAKEERGKGRVLSCVTPFKMVQRKWKARFKTVAAKSPSSFPVVLLYCTCNHMVN